MVITTPGLPSCVVGDLKILTCAGAPANSANAASNPPPTHFICNAKSPSSIAKTFGVGRGAEGVVTVSLTVASTGGARTIAVPRWYFSTSFKGHLSCLNC